MGLDYRVRCCPDGLVTDRRRRIKVLDCTIRDGGISNSWHFEHELVNRVFRALVEANIDIMEVGYRTTAGHEKFPRDRVGPWRFCDEEDLVRVVEPGHIPLSAMVDIGRIKLTDIPPKKDTVVDIIRVASYHYQIEEALMFIQHCLENGYTTYYQLMAVSDIEPPKLDYCLRRVARSGVHGMYIVDSYGALYPYHVRYLVQKYKNWLPEDMMVGVHCHNNQQQAFANTIAAIDAGVDMVDATVHGLGRGAGNCPLELLLFYLDNPNYNASPILDLVDEFASMRDQYRWGYHLPYAITGYYAVHPRDGIALMERPDRYKCRTFYESMMERLAQRDDLPPPRSK